MNEYQLDLDDQIDLAIGRIARQHAFLESMLRGLWMDLVGVGLASYIVNNAQFKRLMEECRAMLREVDLPEDLRTIFFDVLAAVSSASEARNRAAHDMWLTEVNPGTAAVTITRHRAKRGSSGLQPTVVELTWLHQAVKKQQRVGARLTALRLLLPLHIPSIQREWTGSDPPYTQLREIAADRFEVSPNGSLRTRPDVSPSE